MELVPIDDLELLERNPRKITDDQFKKLVKSLKDDPSFFHARPCLVNRIEDHLTVYAGNQRVRAAKKLGWKQVPCIIDDDLDLDTMQSRVIKDNAHYGSWDYDILSSDYELESLLGFGFTESTLGLDIGMEEETKKEKKKKICKHCGEEL